MCHEYIARPCAIMVEPGIRKRSPRAGAKGTELCLNYNLMAGLGCSVAGVVMGQGHEVVLVVVGEKVSASYHCINPRECQWASLCVYVCVFLTDTCRNRNTHLPYVRCLWNSFIKRFVHF